MYEIFVELLKANNVTPYQVSKATGVAQSSLSDWKKGKSKPKYEKMVLLANFFGVSVDYLLTGEEKENPLTAISGSKGSDDDTKIFKAIQSLPPERKKALLQLLEIE